MPGVLLSRHNASAGTTTVRALGSLDPAAFDRIRCQMVLEYCKWDPQVGDVGTLAPFPLVISESTWRQLARWVESLAAEAASAEAELFTRSELLRALGMPRKICRALARGPATPALARVVRFDFHPTTEGWRISKANSDVPGGFTEASSFTQLMAGHYSRLRGAGDPTARWADAVSSRIGPGGSVALLAAPGYMEDQQVVGYLAGALNCRGLSTCICDPRQLLWIRGRAFFNGTARPTPLAGIVRFYQGEWLSRLPDRMRWRTFFTGGITPVCNPGAALIVESKRFPLVWDALQTSLPTWRKLLPETRDPRDVEWRRDSSWLLKAAFCNNGDEVAIRGVSQPAQWCRAARSARWNASAWVAQRRFEAVEVPTPLGPMLACLGVYVINGKACGIYGRISRGAVIDYQAIDVAVLVENESGQGGAL